MVAKRMMLMAVLVLSGCGICDRYCERQRDKCQTYYSQPQCAPTPVNYNNCAPSGVVPVPQYSSYPQPAQPYCP